MTSGEVDSERVQCPTVNAARGPDRLTTPVRVLVVEDHPAMRQLLCEIIEDLGAEALTAPGFASALALARQQPIDLVLTDAMLGPGPNGIALAETLRDERPELDIVVVSAASAPTGDDRLAAQGIDYWEKPLDVEQLARRIAAKR